MAGSKKGKKIQNKQKPKKSEKKGSVKKNSAKSVSSKSKGSKNTEESQTFNLDKKRINEFLFGHEEILWQDYAAMGFLGFLIVLFLYSYLKFLNVI